MDERKFLNNKERKRYELHTDGSVAFADYLVNKEGVVYMTHTEVPVALEGRGIASELIEKSLRDIESGGGKVFPICPFVTAYIRKHPEWQSLVK